jgi:SAM-dependent methyltransferase
MMRRMTSGLLVLALLSFERSLAAPVQAPARAAAEQPPDELPAHLAYLPLDVADRMLTLAAVTGDDLVYDLGCGDARVAILAARKFGARAVCVDHDAKRMAEARANAEREGAADRVSFLQQESVSLTDATVVTMSTPQSAPWLGLNGLLNPTLTGQLKPGTRVVSNFVPGSMASWKPERVDRFVDAKGTARAILYLWRIDAAARP